MRSRSASLLAVWRGVRASASRPEARGRAGVLLARLTGVLDQVPEHDERSLRIAPDAKDESPAAGRGSRSKRRVQDRPRTTCSLSADELGNDEGRPSGPAGGLRLQGRRGPAIRAEMVRPDNLYADETVMP